MLSQLGPDLLHSLAELIDSGGNGNQLGTTLGATAASHAHMLLTKAGLVVVELVENLIPHTVSGSGTEFPLTSHLIEAGNLTGSRHPAALTYLRVVSIDNIPGGKAGAGRTGYRTGTAENAAAVILLPH